MGVKKKSLKGKGRYAKYYANSSLIRNTRKNLERHIKNQPNDDQAKVKLEKVNSGKGSVGRKRL